MVPTDWDDMDSKFAFLWWLETLNTLRSSCQAFVFRLLRISVLIIAYELIAVLFFLEFIFCSSLFSLDVNPLSAVYLAKMCSFL